MMHGERIEGGGFRGENLALRVEGVRATGSHSHEIFFALSKKNRIFANQFDTNNKKSKLKYLITKF